MDQTKSTELVQQILWFKAITYESKEQQNFDTSLELLL